MLYFFSSRRRHTVCSRDWSSDVCSSDLREALRELGARGVIQPVRVVVQLPEGESALSGRRLPGLKALTDSIQKDPRVREVRGVASIKSRMSTLQLVLYYSDPAAVRAKNPNFFNAYLSADNRVTLLDVIPA